MTTQPILPGYQLNHKIYDGFKTVVYQGTRKSDDWPVVIKLSKKEYPNLSELVQFRNQFTIANALNLAGVVQPLELLHYQNSYALILTDDGSIPLTNYAQIPFNLDTFFPLALQLAEILQGLYQHRVIHKDIKPANILIHPISQTVKLIDFSIASLLPKETQEIQNPNILEGTLAYLSPEQTGRMNRGIDYRSDFYSLGVTFYELLTGELPFNATDSMEWVYCHLAKTPPSLENRKNIPAMVAKIVSKLMAKNAEDRYQSAFGLKSDLEECWRQWQQTGQIIAFELGQQDICDRFVIPEKLYGRESEVIQLLNAFERVAGGHREMVLVAGFSGIGKTAVVNEVHKPIVRQRGAFINGKFDQFQRNIPFSAFVQAFRELMGYLLAETETQLTQWRRKILEAVGDNGQVIIDVIPELAQIIGEQPPVPQLSGSANQNRFNLLFQRFIQVFTTAEHPLVIFLDDLQWADAASLKLIQVLMSDSVAGYLLLIGAYRDNEVSTSHPLMRTLEEIQKSGTSLETVTLKPLNQGTVNQLIADTLNCTTVAAKPLTELVYQKTKGNPFFTTQFLKALQEEGYITFYPPQSSLGKEGSQKESGGWQCDLTQVRRLTLTDDVVEFMAWQLQKLPPATQNLLKLAACIGNQFNLETLAIVSEQSAVVASGQLWPALQEGLIVPVNEVYKFYHTETSLNLSNSPISLEGEECIYRFLHDRVQQAAYSLIPDSEKKLTQLKIGQLLLQNLSETEREEQIFAIVNPLNDGVELITELAQRDQLVELNLVAGKKAKTASAYGAALGYFRKGLELLSANSWQRQYALTLTLHVEAIEAAYLHTQFTEAATLAEIVLNNTQTLLDRVRVYELQMQMCVAQLEMLKAIDIGLQVLEMLGITLEPPAPPDVQVAELAGLPTMTDAKALAAMKILMSLISSAYFVNPALMPQIIFTTIQLSRKYGNSPDSGYGYVLYGLLLCGPFANIPLGYEYGQLALQVLDKFDAKELKTRIFLVFNGNIRHWKEHIKTTLDPLLEAVENGLEVGDIEYTGYACTNYCDQAFAIGEPLEKLARERQHYVDLMSSLKQEYVIYYQSMALQLIQNLLGKAENPIQLVGSAFDEEKMVPVFRETNNATLLFNFYLAKGRLLYWFGHPQAAADALHSAAEFVNSVAGMVTVGERNFYESLALLATCNPSETSETLWQTLDRNQAEMAIWATCAPANYQHKLNLIAAEKARVLGDHTLAMELYDQAITGAKQYQYLHEESLANERAALFYQEWGKSKIAQTYLIEAYYGYARWGAKAKIRQLEQQYPELLTPILHQDTSSISVVSEPISYNPQTVTHTSYESSLLLDYSTLLKAARSISTEIELGKLLSTLMHVVMENAGAQTGALLWQQQEQWLVINPETQIPQLLENASVPQNLIHYVARTQETLVLENAAQQDQFANDPYFSQYQPLSLLCMPIVKQGKLIGILYLENAITMGAFTRSRLEVLNLLTAQAAVSLENALLYQNLQEYNQNLEDKVKERTQQLNQKNQRLAQALQELKKTQTRLIQTEKMSSLGQLVAGIAHEINNPISFIRGNVSHAKEYFNNLLKLIQAYQQECINPSSKINQLIEEIDLEFLVEDLEKMLTSMTVGSERVRDIVLCLRTFSRLDESELKSVNLHENLESTLMIVQGRIYEKLGSQGIQVVKNYDDLPFVECYAGQLNQVFMNLLLNAIDALEEMQHKSDENYIPTLSITTEYVAGHSPANSTVSIQIQDNGSGIDPKIKNRIFEPFFTTKSVGKGTGLGLAMSYQIIVDQHHGQLDCHSVLGQGSEFIITLPLSQVQSTIDNR